MTAGVETGRFHFTLKLNLFREGVANIVTTIGLPAIYYDVMECGFNALCTLLSSHHQLILHQYQLLRSKHDPRYNKMSRYVNPLLRQVLYRMRNDSTMKDHCLQYVKTLRRFQLDGHQTVYFGATNISESLITGEKPDHKQNLKYPSWSLIHAGGSLGWVPWNFRLLFKDDLPADEPGDIFQELCASLTESYGKCVIVVREKKRPLLNRDYPASQSKIKEPLGSINLDLTNITCSPQVAKEYGHELLSVPWGCTYLYPLDVAWSAMKWFIVNNRKEFILMSTPAYGSYRCILVSDLIGKGIEKMSTDRWQALTNKVHKWENHYLNKFS